MFIRKTQQIKSSQESIAELSTVSIGGLKQTVLIRGEDVKNPIMLFLHGGPGTAQIGFAPKFQTELEKHFVVVNWDQRGAGLSYTKDLRKEEMTVENMVRDTIEVTEYLLERFNQEKLYLVGHSWGTVLGTLVASNHPEYIQAYIGIGQVVNMQEGEKISYQYTLRKAKEENHSKAIKELEETEFNPLDMKYLNKQRKWLTKFGGSFIGISMYKLIYSSMLFGTEYKMRDWNHYIKAGKFSLESLWSQLIDIDFTKSVPELEVPVYFFAGKHDYQTPFELVEKYYESLTCPKKELVWFENSGHLLNYEECEKFNQECMKIKESHS